MLAEALLLQYADVLDQALARADARAAGLAPTELVTVLVDLMVEPRRDRSGVLDLKIQRGADKRLAVRNALRQRIAAILVATVSDIRRCLAAPDASERPLAPILAVRFAIRRA